MKQYTVSQWHALSEAERDKLQAQAIITLGYYSARNIELKSAVQILIDRLDDYEAQLAVAKGEHHARPGC